MKYIGLILTGCLLGQWLYHLAWKLCAYQEGDVKQKRLSEMFGVILLVSLENRFGLETSHFYFFLVFFILLLLASDMDLMIYAFDVRIIYILWGLSLGKFLLLQVSLLESVLSLIFFYILFQMLLKGMTIYLNSEGMGEGDVGIFLILAFIFGFYLTLWIVLVSCLLAIPFSFQGKIPFVPFISVACLIVICFFL